MEVRAITKYVRLSPTKARDLTRAIQGLPVAQALAKVSISRRKAAEHISRTLKSAIANAEHNTNLAVDDLTVKEAVVDEGPTMKRYWSRSRGMVRPIHRKMCHIKIVLSDGVQAQE